MCASLNRHVLLVRLRLVNCFSQIDKIRVRRFHVISLWPSSPGPPAAHRPPCSTIASIWTIPRTPYSRNASICPAAIEIFQVIRQ